MEAVRFASCEVVQRRRVRRCFEVANPGLVVEQRRRLRVLCLDIRCIARAHLARSHRCDSRDPCCVVGGELSAKAHPRANRTGPSAFRWIDLVVGQHLWGVRPRRRCPAALRSASKSEQTLIELN